MEFEKIGGMMQYREIEYHSEKEWHEIRRKYIGGSDCSIILGYNEYKNVVDLWQEKTGRKEQDDLSNNKAIIRGKESENLLMEHFKINNPKYVVSKLEKSLISLKFPFMLANLDGILEHQEMGKGILEIKTATCHSYGIYKLKWKNEVPIEYYLQVQHYLAVTGWDYAILYADIKLAFADNKHEIRQYFIQREEIDIAEIIKKEAEFFEYLKNDEQPPFIKKIAI